jgi:hypothetical protein
MEGKIQHYLNIVSQASRSYRKAADSFNVVRVAQRRMCEGALSESLVADPNTVYYARPTLW